MITIALKNIFYPLKFNNYGRRKKQSSSSSELVKATAEANGIFGKMGQAIDKYVKDGVTELDVIKVAEAAGLKLDVATLKDLKVHRIIYVILSYHVGA